MLRVKIDIFKHVWNIEDNVGRYETLIKCFIEIILLNFFYMLIFLKDTNLVFLINKNF